MWKERARRERRGYVWATLLLGRYNKRGTKLDTQGVVHSGGRFGIPKEINLTDNLERRQLFGDFDSLARRNRINQYKSI
jgi:hypothetical protein